MSNQRRGGIIQFAVNGVLYECKGEFTLNFGRNKRKTVVGSDGVHGYTEEPQPASIEGKITDRGDLDVAALLDTTEATVTLLEANGKTFALRDAWYAGDGNVTTGEGEIEVRFEGKSAEEVGA